MFYMRPTLLLFEEVIQGMLGLLANSAVDWPAKVLAVVFVLCVLGMGVYALIVLAAWRRPRREESPSARRRESKGGPSGPRGGPSGPSNGALTAKRTRRRQQPKRGEQQAPPARAPSKRRNPARRRGTTIRQA